jgi:hypothetical protein
MHGGKELCKSTALAVTMNHPKTSLSVDTFAGTLTFFICCAFN